jgi:hypothetical protein
MTSTAGFDLAMGGVVMPFVIAFINQSKWDPKVRGMVAFVACVGAAALLALLHGTLTLDHWRDTAILVTGSAMVMYHALWKPSGLAPALEDATSPSGVTPSQPAP